MQGLESIVKQDSMEGKILKAVLDSTTTLKEDNVVLRRQLVGVLNVLYPFIASNPAFDCINGTGRLTSLLYSQRKRLTKIIVNRGYLSHNDEVAKAEKLREGQTEETKTMINMWLQDLGEFDPTSDSHIKKCLDHAGSLDTQEQDKTQYIMNSKSFQDWLDKPTTSLLQVGSETAPESLISFMSLSIAMLALTLGGSTNFAVLSFFCGLRKSESYNETDSGVLGILKSLNGQLLKFILAKQPSTRLSVQDKVWQNSGNELKYAKALFKQLLSLLPDGCVVFVLLDSASRVFGDKTQVDELVQRILKVADQQPNHLVVKMLVTDPLAISRIRKLAHHSIYVPDDVDGWNCGMNMALVDQSNRSKLRGLGGQKRLMQRESSEDDLQTSGTESDDSS